MNRDGNYLAADQVIWDRKTGQVYARSAMSSSCTPQGDKMVGDNVQLTDTLRDGTVDNLMVVLESGARIAAARGRRTGDVTTLENAIYSPCPVTTSTGCPEAAELGDHRGAGDRRPDQRPSALHRRPAAAVRDHPAAPARVQHFARE